MSRPKRQRTRKVPPSPAPPPTPSPSPTPEAVPPASGDAPEAELEQLVSTFRQEDLDQLAAPADVIPPAAPAAAAAPAPDPTFDARDFGGRLAGLAFVMIAARYGEHWKLKDQERAALADALAPLFARASSHMTGVWMEAAVAAVVLSSIVLPRLEQQRQLPPAPEAPRAEEH